MWRSTASYSEKCLPFSLNYSQGEYIHCMTHIHTSFSERVRVNLVEETWKNHSITVREKTKRKRMYARRKKLLRKFSIRLLVFLKRKRTETYFCINATLKFLFILYFTSIELPVFKGTEEMRLWKEKIIKNLSLFVSRTSNFIPVNTGNNILVLKAHRISQSRA